MIEFLMCCVFCYLFIDVCQIIINSHKRNGDKK